MAYDEALAERVKAIVGARDAVTERKMFGGIAWMVGGNLACGVMGDDVCVKLSVEDAETALERPDTRPFQIGDQPPAKTFVIVAGSAVAEDGELARWVDAGADHAASLAPK
jgi:TfoX/Sxy family transcriptional regulator of competence genes